MPRTAWFGLVIALAALPSLAVPAAADELPATADPAPASSDASVNSPTNLDDAWSSPDVVSPHFDSRPLERRSRNAAPLIGGKESNGGTASSWWRTTLSLGGVVALIAMLAWGYRRATGGGLPSILRGRSSGLIEVLGRTSLSPRQSLCLVRVGSRLVLLGCSQDSIRALDVITDGELASRMAGHVATQHPDSHTAEFSRCLETEAKAYGSSTPEADETVVPDQRRLEAVRKQLGDVVQRLRARTAAPA